MIEESVAEKEEKVALNFEEPKPQFFSEEELNASASVFEEVEPPAAPVKYSTIVESHLSAMAGEQSFKDVRFKADMQESERRSRAIEALAYGVPAHAATFKTAATELLQAPLTKRTVGESIAQTIQNNHPLPQIKAMGQDLDVAINKLANNKGIVENLEANSYDEVMNTPSEDTYNAVKSIVKNNPKELKRLENNYDPKSFTNSNALDYINPLGGELSTGMEWGFWDTLKRIVTGDLSYNEFDGFMESNYGSEWEGRWAAWMAKEVAIDGTILFLGTRVPFLKPYLTTLKSSTFMPKMKAAASRAVLVGVGGGTAQIGQNAILDRELDVGTEIIGRTLGYGAGEALLAGAKIGGRKAKEAISELMGSSKKEAIANVARRNNVKPVAHSALSKIMDSHQFHLSPSSVLIMNSLDNHVKNYQAFVGKISNDVLAKRDMEAQGYGKEIRDNLSDMLGMDRGAIDNLEIDAILPDIVKMSKGFDAEVAKQRASGAFRNQTEFSRGLSTTLFASVRGQYENMTKDVEMYLSETGLNLRMTDDGIAKGGASKMISKSLMATRLTEPVNVVFQSSSNYLAARNYTNKVANGLRIMYKDAIKGLSKDELNILDSVLKEGDAKHLVFDQVDTFSQHGIMNKKVFDSYVKMRYALDLSYELMDKAKVSSLKGDIDKPARGKVFRVDTDSGSQFYQIIGKEPIVKGAPSSGNAQQYGGVKYRAKLFDNKSLSSDRGAVRELLPHELKEITTIVPYRNGHIPRVYRPQKFSVVVINPGKGIVSREAMFDSSVEAAQYVQKRKSDDMRQDGEIIVQFFDNMETGFGGFRTDSTSTDLLRALNNEEKSTITNILKSKGLNPENVNLVLRGLNDPKAEAGGKHALSRTELGTATTEGGRKLRLKLAKLQKAKKEAKGDKLKSLQAAETLLRKEIKKEVSLNTAPTREAILEYFGTVAHGAGFDNWRTFAIDDFMKRYGKHLQPGGTYNNLKFGPDVEQAIQKEAKRYGNWIEAKITQRTSVEKALDNWLGRFALNITEKAAKGDPYAAAIVKATDKIPMMNTVYGALRFTAASPKLLTLNIPQIAIQGSQLLVTASTAMAKNPVLATKAMTQLPMMGVIHAIKGLRKDVPASFKKTDAYKAYQDLVKSGYASDLLTTDTMFGMRNHLDPNGGRKLWEFSKLLMAAPFRGGEAINRVGAFLAVRQQIIHGINKSAKLDRSKLSSKQLEQLTNDIMGFDGAVLTKADIGSQQFRDAVVNKAQVLALNMSKAGELEALSGANSVLFQFKQVLPKQISVFDSKALTTREKFAAAGALVTFWGGAGIPLAADLINLLDFTFYDKNDPSTRFLATDFLNGTVEMVARSVEDKSGGFASEEFTKTLLKRGSIAAFSEDEINIISRVALGSFVTDMIDIQHPTDFVVSFAVLSDMLEAVDRVTGTNIDAFPVPTSDTISAATGAAIGGKSFGVRGAVAGGVIGAILNPLSYMEILSRTIKGESFGESVAKQLEPESALGKYFQNEISGWSATLESMREFGKVYSQMGSMSRILDVHNRHVIQPNMDRLNPLAPDYYVSSTLRGIPVEQSSFRDIQLALGFTPGKIVEAYEKQDMQRAYNRALTKYKEKIKKDYRLSFGDYERQRRIRRDAAHNLFKFKQHMESLGLEHKVPKEIMKSLTLQWMGLERDVFTGGKMK